LSIVLSTALIGANVGFTRICDGKKLYQMFVDEDASRGYSTYTYPVSPLDDEWDLLGCEEIRELSQIPQEVLSDISTEELVTLILEYPFLCDINAFDSVEEGYANLKNQFNGINELLEREDCIDILLDTYENYEIPDKKIIDYSAIMSGDEGIKTYNDFIENKENREEIYEDGAVYETIRITEMLLLDAISNRASSDNIKRFMNAYSNKLEQKNNSEYYEDTNPIEVLQVIQKDEGVLNETFFAPNAYELNTVNSNYKIKTPGGVTVTCTYNDNVAYASPSSYTSLLTAYHATLVSVASTTFNCHSFAWLQDLYPNEYTYITLNSVSAFASDSNYKKSSVASVGWIALYSTHSAITMYINKDYPYDSVNYPEAYMISKWGTGPVVAHYEQHNPYYNSGEEIVYYHLK
jgi:hypothetical protein